MENDNNVNNERSEHLESRNSTNKEESKQSSNVKDVNMSVAIERWLDRMKITVQLSSYGMYESMVRNHIYPYFAKYNVSEIGYTQIREFEKFMRKNFANDYSRAVANIAKRIVTFSIEEDEMKFPNQQSENVRNIISAQEQQKIIKALKEDNSISPEIKVAIACALFLGLRISEICALKWKDFNLSTKKLTVKSNVERVKNVYEGGKTVLRVQEKTTRVLYMPKLIRELVKTCKNKNNSEAYVLSTTQSVSDPRVAQQKINVVGKKLGMEKKFKFAILRNTFIYNALQKGISVKVLAIVLDMKASSLLEYVDNMPEPTPEQIKEEMSRVLD